MATGRRVLRLRAMADQIERLPASPDRDRLLSEVRSRAVDVDTGMMPRALLPLREPAPEPEPVSRPAKRERAKVIRRVTPRTPAPSPEMPRLDSARLSSTADPAKDEQWPVLGGHLSLEDTSQPQSLVGGHRAVPPWTLGLRG